MRRHTSVFYELQRFVIWAKLTAIMGDARSLDRCLPSWLGRSCRSVEASRPRPPSSASRLDDRGQGAAGPEIRAWRRRSGPV